ncbi:MAG: hypothetical protein LC803_23335 [Acidobacteria bacterium]|nr:hypothetical protein [Acidobacteriota bacterium]
MTDPKEKNSPSIKTRTPGRLSRGSMFDRVKLRPDQHPIEELLAGGGPALTEADTAQIEPKPIPTPDPDQYQTQTNPVPVPNYDQTHTEVVPKPETRQTSSLPIAPARDYNKRANSIDREALPAGAFPGASKKIYDALYLRTRGAVIPERIIRATRKEMMKWTGIKDIKTINAHVRKLIDAGLIIRTKLVGEHEGSIYEVLLPEETSAKLVPDPYQTQTNAVPGLNQKTDSDQYQKSVRLGSGNLIENKDTSSDLKTSFKTNTERSDDDEAFRQLFVAAKEITGKEVPAAQWREVIDVLVAELKIAAARTTVSSAPAFLAEHLRRRLWKMDKKQAQAEGRELPDQLKTTNTVPDGQICQDCNNTNWWYPNGPDKGVARCKHANLHNNSVD